MFGWFYRGGGLCCGVVVVCCVGVVVCCLVGGFGCVWDVVDFGGFLGVGCFGEWCLLVVAGLSWCVVGVVWLLAVLCGGLLCWVVLWCGVLMLSCLWGVVVGFWIFL